MASKEGNEVLLQNDELIADADSNQNIAKIAIAQPYFPAEGISHDEEPQVALEIAQPQQLKPNQSPADKRKQAMKILLRKYNGQYWRTTALIFWYIMQICWAGYTMLWLILQLGKQDNFKYIFMTPIFSIPWFICIGLMVQGMNNYNLTPTIFAAVCSFTYLIIFVSLTWYGSVAFWPGDIWWLLILIVQYGYIHTVKSLSKTI